MKRFVFASLLGLFLVSLSSAAVPLTFKIAGYGVPVVGNQYVYIEPGNTTVVASHFLCPGSGVLTGDGITTNVVYGTNNPDVVTEQVVNGSNTTLSFTNNYAIGGAFSVKAVAVSGTNYFVSLAGTPPLNASGVPLTINEYQYNPSNQPSTYYVLVTAGKLSGNYFTVLGNTANSLVIDPEGLSINSQDITAINLLSYWTLSGMFPASQATTSFIPTTNASNVMTKIVISPPLTIGTNQPQNVGDSYYFNSSLTNWVNVTNPNVSAGNAIIVPGAYVYVQNTGSNNYPLHSFISGLVMTNQFSIYLSASPTNFIINYSSLPRNTAYRLSEIGFNDLNFTQSSTNKQTLNSDLLIIDDGHGGVGASYYRYKNQWYSTSGPLATNPILPAGTVFGVKKAPSLKQTSVLINRYNGK